jgi:hypothetical protein
VDPKIRPAFLMASPDVRRCVERGSPTETGGERRTMKRPKGELGVREDAVIER